MKVAQSSLWSHELYSPWNSPCQNTLGGSLSLLQGIFPTQGSNPGLLHCRWILYQLSYKGSPRMPEWVDHPFSRGSSQPGNRTGVSCIAGRFFTNWAMREAPRWYLKVWCDVLWWHLTVYRKKQRYGKREPLDTLACRRLEDGDMWQKRLKKSG